MLDRPQRPLFRPGVRGIDEGFTEIEFAAVAEILGQALEQAIEAAAALPLLKASMTRLVRRVARREIGPRGARAQHPEHAVEHGACIGPRASTPIRTSPGPKRRFEHRPLGVGEIHAARYDTPRPVVTRPVSYL